MALTNGVWVYIYRREVLMHYYTLQYIKFHKVIMMTVNISRTFSRREAFFVNQPAAATDSARLMWNFGSRNTKK